MNDLDPQLAEMVYDLIASLTNKQNHYFYCTRMQIKDNFYKIRISLKDVDEELDAKETTIYIRRLNND